MARSGQTREEVVANVLAAIKGAVDLTPKKWGNVQGLFLKTTESVALPVYQALPEAPRRIAGSGKKGEESEEEAAESEEE